MENSPRKSGWQKNAQREVGERSEQELQANSEHIGAAMHAIEGAEDARAMMSPPDDTPALDLRRGNRHFERRIIEQPCRATIGMTARLERRYFTGIGQTVADRHRGIEPGIPGKALPANERRHVVFQVRLPGEMLAQLALDFPLPGR